MIALKIEEEDGVHQQWKRHLENFKNKQKYPYLPSNFAFTRSIFCLS